MAIQSIKLLRVALVDDQNIVREAFAALIDESGIAEVIASYPHAGVSAAELRQQNVGAVLIGFEAQLSDPLQTVSVLALSLPGVPLCALVGGGQPTIVHNAMKAGCTCAVSTGSSVEVLIAALRALNLGQAWVDPNLGGRLLIAEYGGGGKTGANGCNDLPPTQH
jgi:DNA-binding NarL/FixJ family response regulator